jgi:hypothetical protein
MIQLVANMIMAVALIADSSGAEPEEILEALPYVFKKLEENYKRQEPAYVILNQPL